MQHAIAHGSEDVAFKSLGLYTHQELLAWELANKLDDPAGISLYRSHCQRYPEAVIRQALTDAIQVPASMLKQGRITLFNYYLFQHHDQGANQNPGR